MGVFFVLSASCKSPKVRRLSTVSSVVAAAGHVFSTRWNWYWKDENNKWQSYDTPSDGHAVNTTSSQCLEREYVAGRDIYKEVMLLGTKEGDRGRKPESIGGGESS